MTKRRMTRLDRCAAVIMLAAGISLGIAVLPGAGFAGPQWQIIEYPLPTSLDPDEVIAYEHANFIGRYIRFKLQPGMRQLLVPVLPDAFNDVISSIQVGSNVAVMVFEDANFGDLEGHQATGVVTHQWPPSFYILDDSRKVIDRNDAISALIVFPRSLVQPMGVVLSDEGKYDYGYKFYPLPESSDSTEAKYSHLPDMDDDANEVRVYPYDRNSPGCGKVYVTLYESPHLQGRNITLPGGDGAMPGDGLFKLGDYQFNDTASSLAVRWVDNSLAFQTPSTSARVSAPPAPDTGGTPAPAGTGPKKAPADKKPTLSLPAVVIVAGLSGQWNSNIGAVYEIQQSGGQFTWSAPSLNQSGTGTVSGDDVTLSSPGWTVKGKITEKDASGNPTKIVGENGVILFRAAGAAPGTPLAPSVISLAGEWKSSIGRIYVITQQGDKIAWTVVSSDEKGQGAITGSDVSASWKGFFGSGSAAGKITVDASGKATEIKWQNGVRFYR